VSFDVLNVVEFCGEGVVDVDGDDFPVCFAFVEESHCAEDFDLFDLAGVADFFADFADVEGVVVAFCFGFVMDLCRVFPGLSTLLRSSNPPNGGWNEGV
jgi:hypothetical protein